MTCGCRNSTVRAKNAQLSEIKGKVIVQEMLPNVRLR